MKRFKAAGLAAAVAYSTSASLLQPTNTTSNGVKVRRIPTYRPSDEVHIHYAVGAYYELDKYNQAKEKDRWEMKPGWELLASNKNLKTGYFGVAYVNNAQKHIIIVIYPPK